MKRKRVLRGAAIAGVMAGVALTAAPSGAITTTGPSTTTSPYVLPVADGVDITSLYSVADAGAASNGYEMTGIPDGLGARRVGKNVELFMNQELRDTQGVVRDHGQKGAFVTKLKINPATGEVVEGSDLIQSVKFYDYLTDSYASAPNAAGTNAVTGKTFPAYNPAFARFCSGSLTDPLQLFNFRTGRGYAGQIYFANEENGDEGRLFGVTTDGQAQQLPRLGLFSWENTLAARNQSDTTVVMGDEDGAAGQLWVYVGRKQRTGSAFDKAGLTNGTDYVVRVGDGPLNDAGLRAQLASSSDGSARFDLSEVGWQQSGAAQNAEALADGLSLTRIEDGTWDPTNKNVFYFVTTEGGKGATSARDGGGLWRATFDDIENPLAGGKIELLLDGSEGIGLNKPDNITMDVNGGNLLIQEDPGSNPHVARILAYRVADGATAVVATFDPTLFDPTSPTMLTQDEESSGIIDATDTYFTQPRSVKDFFRLLLHRFKGGTFLFDAQVHTSTGLDNPAAQVERGQLLKLEINDWDDVYGG